MKEQLTAADLLPLAQHVATCLAAASDEITSLDAQIGDGDLGVTCRLGMTAAVEALAGLSAPAPEHALMKAGMAFNQAGASTFGALVATAAMRAARYAKEQGRDQWGAGDIAAAARAAAEGIQERGKAERGQKTLLDALWPAIEVLEAEGAAGTTLADALAAAADAAAAGVEATRPLKSMFGRAAWLQEKTVGVPDPGATVTALVFAAISEYVRQ